MPVCHQLEKKSFHYLTNARNSVTIEKVVWLAAQCFLPKEIVKSKISLIRRHSFAKSGGTMTNTGEINFNEIKLHRVGRQQVEARD